MLTFRIAITAAVITFISALTAALVFIQLETFHAAASAAASAAMEPRERKHPLAGSRQRFLG